MFHSKSRLVPCLVSLGLVLVLIKAFTVSASDSAYFVVVVVVVAAAAAAVAAAAGVFTG